MTNTTATDPSKTEQVTSKASDVAGTASQKAGSVASTAKDEAAGVAQDAKQHARRLAGESRDQLRQQADEQGQRLAQTLRDIGGQLRGMASGNEKPTGMVADVTNQAASSAHRLAQTLDQKGVQGVIDDVKRFARQRPGMFFIGALGAGVVAGRLIKAIDTDAVVQAAKPNGQSSEAESDGQSDPAALAGTSRTTMPSSPGGPRTDPTRTEPPSTLHDPPSTLQGPTVVGPTPTMPNRPEL